LPGPPRIKRGGPDTPLRGYLFRLRNPYVMRVSGPSGTWNHDRWDMEPRPAEFLFTALTMA
ncbi:MAG: hypothetical protein M1294_07665, partial [Firmicutes bacterium]|nr:hypothetical protein [Bacillota bacterium]